ncbi:hypothetical protein DYB32_006638 [Aphanomyces invadans]|uniref:IMP-specific 5'-nucleotidase 1 n=1 Tax=Aphanomyces invadans TaxID=157072 RepID=A0A3R6WJ81_9STRA|nr:hypothetical protein DYB32_006638 [Aphanomyces invadans]
MLKEEDPLIELIREWIMAPIDESAGLQLSTLEVFALVEDMINEHVASPQGSRLKKYIPKVKRMFMRINLMDAVHAYDAVTHFSRRKRVPPTFKDVRHILNLATVWRMWMLLACFLMVFAQIRAIAPTLKLVTFDADDTIYADGGSIRYRLVCYICDCREVDSFRGWDSESSDMVTVIVELLKKGLVVSLVTAAGYPGEPQRYEARLRGVGPSSDSAKMVALLDMPAKILRKERAVGIYNPTDKRFVYENLEEIALTVQHVLRHTTIPHCAFNGGNDVWVDIGNKALGISALQHYVVRLVAGSKVRASIVRCLGGSKWEKNL